MLSKDFVILNPGARGKRSILPHSRVMIHQPSGGAHGMASDILIAAREMEKTRGELCPILSLHTGQNYDRLLADMDRDCWMNAAEALEYGMVDMIHNGK